MEKITHSYLNLITLMAFCMNMSAHAFDDNGYYWLSDEEVDERKKQFLVYIQNGDSSDQSERLITIDEVEQIKKDIQEESDRKKIFANVEQIFAYHADREQQQKAVDEVEEIKKYVQGSYRDQDLTPEQMLVRNASYVQQLKANELPCTTVWGLDGTYQHWFHMFVLSVRYKKILLQRISQNKATDNVDQLSNDVKVLEHRMQHISQCLTTARNSGLEHHVFLRNIRGMHGISEITYQKYLHDTPALRTEFWKEVYVQERVLKDWQDAYIDDKPKYPLSLDPVSMAIVRHQLYKGFEGLDYKKTTEYTGPVLCRLKFKGQAPCDWSYEQLKKLLALADEEAKSTTQKKEEAIIEPNNLVATPIRVDEVDPGNGVEYFEKLKCD